MKTLQESRDLLKRLRSEYGEAVRLIDRLRCAELSASNDTLEAEVTEAPPTVEEPTVEEPTVEEPTVEEPTVEEPTVDTQRAKPMRKGFSPILIDNSTDWLKYRMNAGNVSELEKFLRSSDNPQSANFLEVVEQYKAELVDNLNAPADDAIDEEMSHTFVERLAIVISNRLYNIVRSCQAGKRKGDFISRCYYRDIERQMYVYFGRIGLRTFELKAGDPISKAQGHADAREVPTTFARLNNTIEEVIMQPRYFEYYRSDGQVGEYWLEGECTVCKKVEKGQPIWTTASECWRN